MVLCFSGVLFSFMFLDATWIDRASQEAHDEVIDFVTHFLFIARCTLMVIHIKAGLKK